MTTPALITTVFRQGFSILEVMIAVAILATALAAAGGAMYTMHISRASLDEEVKVQGLAQAMAERLQGADWDSLGKTAHPWSWHRRATRQLVHDSIGAPMDEITTNKANNLVDLGIVPTRTDEKGNQIRGLGVRGLQVYLEYYQIRLIDTLAAAMAADPTADPRQIWLKEVGNPTLLVPTSPAGAGANDSAIFLTEDPADFDLSKIDPAVIMRVIIRWESSDGGTRWHEVMVARRK